MICGDQDLREVSLEAVVAENKIQEINRQLLELHKPTQHLLPLSYLHLLHTIVFQRHENEISISTPIFRTDPTTKSEGQEEITKFAKSERQLATITSFQTE